MLLVVERGREDEVLAHLREVGPRRARSSARSPTTASRSCSSAGEVVADLPVEPLTEDAPATTARSRAGRPRATRSALADVARRSATSAPRCSRSARARPNIASKAWICRQYDHIGAARHASSGPARDAAVLRVTGTPRGHRARHRLQRALLLPRPVRRRRAWRSPRRRATSSASAREPLAAHRLPQLRQPGAARDHVAVRARRSRGMADACRALGDADRVGQRLASTTRPTAAPIHPTPTVAHGRRSPTRRRVTRRALPGAGRSHARCSARPTGPRRRAYLRPPRHRARPAAGGRPRGRSARSRSACALVARRRARGAHDLRDGGLAVAVAEMRHGDGIGAELDRSTGDRARRSSARTRRARARAWRRGRHSRARAPRRSACRRARRASLRDARAARGSAALDCHRPGRRGDDARAGALADVRGARWLAG